MEIMVGGERILVGSISGTGPTQTLNGCSRAVNGVTKSHVAGTPVEIADTFRLTFGHHPVANQIAASPPVSNSGIISYNDPYTGQPILRITRDGADRQAVNYMGPVESVSSWSPDSNRLVVSKWIATDPANSGIHVFDLTAMRWAPIVNTWLWAFPIFDHSGTHVWYIHSDGTFNANGRNYELRRAAVPTNLNFDAPIGTTSELMLDIRAAAAAAGAGEVTNALVLAKNHVAPGPAEIFSFGVETAAGMRTMFTSGGGGSFIPSWGFDQDPNSNIGDGDSVVWARNDGYNIRAHRAPAGPGSDQRAIWSFNPPTALYDIADGGGGESIIAHSDWGYHAGTSTDIHVGGWRWPATRTAGVTTYYPTKGLIFGEVHTTLDQASTSGPLSGVRVVNVEYHIGSGSRGQMYMWTLGDYDIGGVTHPEIVGWQDIRSLRHLLGPRNSLNPNFVNNLAAFSSHPNFSPNGHWIAWQSTSEIDLETPQSELRTHWYYPEEICGPAGGTDGTQFAFLDIYLTYVGP
jgi:hypothetical protein